MISNCHSLYCKVHSVVVFTMYSYFLFLFMLRGLIKTNTCKCDSDDDHIEVVPPLVIGIPPVGTTSLRNMMCN